MNAVTGAAGNGLSITSETLEANRGSSFMRPVEAIAAVLLVAIVGMLFAGVVSRYFFNRPIVWIDEAASIAFLWLAMLGTAIAVDRGEHLRLTVLLSRLTERRRRMAETFGLVLTGALLAVLLPCAYDYAIGEMEITSSAINIPAGYRASAIAVGIALMLGLVVVRLFHSSRPRDVLASAAIVVAVSLALWVLSPAIRPFGDLNIVVFLVGGSAVCLALGIPIAFCFGIATLMFLSFTTHMPLIVMVSRMDEGMSSLILLSVPIFVLLGCILDVTGMGKAIWISSLRCSATSRQACPSCYSGRCSWFPAYRAQRFPTWRPLPRLYSLK